MDFGQPFFNEDLLKLVLAVLAGGAIGIEREMRDKDAGFRTLIFICTGATLFTIFSMRFSTEGDPARVAANIVSGVGFLGAGVILRERGQVRGLTTAATIWLAAAMGMGIGAGHYILTIVATLNILFILLVFPIIEGWIGRFTETRAYVITCRRDPKKVEDIHHLWQQHRLTVLRRRLEVREDLITCTWEVFGKTSNHEKMVEYLFADPELIEFHY